MNLKKCFIYTLTMLMLVTLLGSPSLFAAGNALKVTSVAENLYAIIGIEGNSNLVFLVTGDGVLVVDSSNKPDDAKKRIALIKEKTSKPIKYVILTHYHFDHSGGLSEFSGAEVIASEACAKNLATIGEEKLKRNIEKSYPDYIEGLRSKIEALKKENSPKLKETEAHLIDVEKQLEELNKTKLVIPTSTFKDKKILTFGKEKIEIIFPGRTHTGGSAIVYFPGKKTIVMGDMFFNNYFPFIDWKAGSDTANWAAFLGKLAAWDFEKAVPGHGLITGKDGIKRMQDYLLALRSSVKEAKQKGLSLDEMKKSIKLEKFAEMGFPFYLPIGIDAVYHELEKK
ncbi:MAG: MBL fold metallo-hydrolase [bacterium]|nr:MBL fold metallo-hydrolase [bacterium]